MKARARHLATTCVTLIGLVAFNVQIARADSITLRIVQSGWTGGGQVVGMFTGDDLNHDGILALDAGEILDYDIRFTGNALVRDFTHGLAALKFFRYTLGTSGFPPSFPLFSDNSAFFYDADDKLIGRSGFGPPFISTPQAATVSPVPEPSSVILVSTGVLGLMYRRSRSRS